MTTLAEFMIIASADNHPPMLEKSLYDSWKSRMEHYIENRENGRIILNSVQNGPLIWPTVTEEDGTIRTKKYKELSATEKIEADCDCKATNIILQGLPPNVYAIVNHHKVTKEIWDRVKLLMQGKKISLKEKECKLYDEFDKFTFVKGETLYQYYWRFSQLINNINVIDMSMRVVQVNTKFLNSLPPEWSKFVTNVKLARDLHTTNYDQLYSYLEQHEVHANETRLMRECYQDPPTHVPQQTNNMIPQVHSYQSYSPMYPSKETKSSSSKGTKSQPKTSGKSVQAEELVFETVDTEMQQDQGGDLGNTEDQPNVEEASKHDWFKKPERPPTPDRKPPLTFDELMSTPIDFSTYVLNNLKIENLTQEYLVGPAFNLLKGTCKSRVELEYYFEECYKAVNDKLDWKNPQGHEYPFDLSKPLPLIEDQGRQVVPANYFINNDLEYLKDGSLSRKYTTSTTKTKAAKYDTIKGIEDMVSSLWSQLKHDVFSMKRIIAVTHVKVIKKYDYGYLEEIIVRREDQQLHKFVEGDFPRLNLRDIEDMLLLLVEDLQLGVESYQKKLNITKPETFRIGSTGMNRGQDRQTADVGANGGNQFRQYAGQNVGYQNGIWLENGKCLLAARAEGNAPRNAQVRPREKDAAFSTLLLIAQKGRSRNPIKRKTSIDIGLLRLKMLPFYDSAVLAEVKQLMTNAMMMGEQFRSTSATVRKTRVTLIKNLFDSIPVTRAQSKSIIDSFGKTNLQDKILENAKLRAPVFDKGVDNTAKTRRPQPRSNTKNDRVPSVSKSSCK
ncbi:hypothetical protein Tco_0044707 [Tanacetum coccineum]